MATCGMHNRSKPPTKDNIARAPTLGVTSALSLAGPQPKVCLNLYMGGGVCVYICEAFSSSITLGCSTD